MTRAMQKRIGYVEISSYKYRLAYDYVHPLTIAVPERSIPGFITLTPIDNENWRGILKIRAGYAWDGPSGPTVDSPAFMRGSLVHDALYQMIRRGHLAPPDDWRLKADVLLREICAEDGMSWFRSRYVYAAVRLFGRGAAEPRNDPDPQERILWAP